MPTIEDAEKGMTPTTLPPSYKSSQTYHGASRDVAIEKSDANTDRSNGSTHHDPAMTENHATHLSASDAPGADIGNEPDLDDPTCFALFLRDATPAVRCFFAVHSVGFVCVLYHLVVASLGEDCAQAPELTAYLDYLLGAVMGMICAKFPTFRGLHHNFDDSEGAEWVLAGLGWWLAMIVGSWMVTTWTPAYCET
ncbi:hypothetical protein KC361_g6093 [Hortaea werneckii]|nr:hypothetical protein KC361_g6093 [Hortaea werneckii]